MKAVVTGIAGFIGSHIAERLLELGATVIGIDDLSAGYKCNIPEGVEFHKIDICDIENHNQILKGVDVVFHQAASKKNICLRDPIRDLEVNGAGTLMLLQQSLRLNVPKFVHASTGSVYGEVKGVITEKSPRKPCSFYGISKMAGESYVCLFNKQYKLNTTILRYFHVYGERQEKKQETGGVVAIFTDKIKKGETIHIHGNGEQVRVFTYVKDIVDANIVSAINPISNGKVYNCASSEKTTIADLAIMLMNKYGRRVPILYDSPLIGDIANFDVDAFKISELGVNFRPISEILGL